MFEGNQGVVQQNSSKMIVSKRCRFNPLIATCHVNLANIIP